MTREDIVNAMSLEDAIQVFRDTNCYGTMDIAKTVILRALEQEPCRETADYENEIEDLHNRLDIAEYDKERLREEVTRLEEKIKALEQEPKEWIPVSEQIPIIETDVLLTSWNGKAEYVGWIDAFGKWYADEEEVIDGYEPLAWMPLPEPYKEE